MRYSLLLLLMVISVSSFSQDYRRLNVGLGSGYIYGGDYAAGVLLYFEPSYRMNNRISFGLRLEGLFGELERGFSGTGSYSLNAKYYFLNGRFQPFAGLGAGYTIHPLELERNVIVSDRLKLLQDFIPGLDLPTGI